MLKDLQNYVIGLKISILTSKNKILLKKTKQRLYSKDKVI